MIENIYEFIHNNNFTCDDSGNIYVRVVDGGLQFFPIENLEDCILVNPETMEAVMKGKLKYDAQTGTFVEVKDFTKEIAKIEKLKKKLSDTDYQAIKYAEGVLSEAEYAPMKAQRQEWRAEINRLEAEIQKA